MKRILLLLMVVLLLTGCGADQTPETQSEQKEVQTDWIAENASPWDQDGMLLEIPLTVPGGMQYSMSLEFDGRLLLWSMDAHLTDAMELELCLVELDDGTVSAMQEIAVKGAVTPQPLGDKLYICDSEGGLILELDKNLQETRRWETEPESATWYMGAGETLYRHDLELRFSAEDLSTGERTSLLPDDPEVLIVGNQEKSLTLQYYRPDTGAQEWAALDLQSGTVTQVDTGFGYDSLSVVADSWLATKYEDGYVYTLCTAGNERVNVTAPAHYLQLLEDGNILSTADDGLYMHLYDSRGKALSSCQLSDNGSYSASRPIRSEKYGGYFFIARGFEDHCRLMFWDTSRGTDEKDLVFTDIPKPSEELVALRNRCQEIGEKHGVNILVGDDCDTAFSDFTASTVSDWARVNGALVVLEDALEDYPEGFIRQLRHDSVHGVQIQLVSDLQASGGTRSGDGYAAFTQEMWDHYLIVVDIDDATEETYYHEFSHIIDSCLEWDSWQRNDALYSEDGWMELNPDWFDGYSYDYSYLPDLEDETCFVDSYSMISPTEDRARVLEFAMYEYGRGTFENAPVLQSKLDYYCRCIREVFDTTLWPEEVLWEQYLS